MGKLLNKLGNVKNDFDDKVYIGHKDLIVDMLMINKLNYLISASMDKTIIVWDLTTFKIRRVYKDHKKVKIRRAYQL